MSQDSWAIQTLAVIPSKYHQRSPVKFNTNIPNTANVAVHHTADTESSYISAYGLIEWPELWFHQTHRVPGPSADSLSLSSKPYFEA